MSRGLLSLPCELVVWCGMSEKCLKLKVFAKIDFIAFLASLGVK